MINDFFLIFSWWFLLFGLGLIFLPLTFFFFSKFFDQGYALSKIIGILLVSYLVWLLGSLKILPFSELTVWLVMIFLLIANFLLSKKLKINFRKKLKENWRIFLFEESLFFFCLLFWSFLRGFQPEIHGLEKFMDFGFVNTLLRSKYFPPADMWLAGQKINYYYFGHLITAVLTKLSGFDSAITYNLMIATLFALSFTASFSLGANLTFFAQNHRKLAIRNWKLPVIAGILTACLLTLGGNLHPLWYLINNGNYKSYWYPDATRFIVEEFGASDNTIHEFPIYSFVVADLHGHLINLPMVLLFLSLIFSLFLDKKLLIGITKESREAVNWKLGIGNLMFPALLLGTFYMTNAWDLPIYLLVLGLVIFYSNYQKFNLKIKTFTQTFLSVLFTILLSIFLTLPFHLHFKSMVGGLGITDFHSPLWMLLVLWVFPLLMTIIFLLFLKNQSLKHRSLASDHFVLILLSVSWFLVIIPEFFYLKDIYIHSYQRANTMFKFTYQSFVMFSLADGYIIIRILTGLKNHLLKFFCSLSFVLCSIFIFIYPYFAIKSFYGLKNYRGLNGLSYLQSLYPDDYQALSWLREKVPDQPVIVEAVGESYTDFARVSANTGLPTILGWRVHEWLWRGSFDEPGERTEEVKTIYESLNLSSTKKILQKYQVKYLFWGALEKEAYPEAKESKFDQLGQVVFSSHQTKIWQIKDFQEDF